MALPFLKTKPTPKRTIQKLNRPQGSPEIERQSRKYEMLAEALTNLAQKLTNLSLRVKESSCEKAETALVNDIFDTLSEISEALPN